MQTPKAPEAPDPYKTADAQTQTNLATAQAQTQLNSQNQVTPYGNITYEQTGTWADGTPKYTATTTLSPEQQAILNQNQKLATTTGAIAQNQADKIGGILGTNVDLSSGNINSYVDNHYLDDFNKTWDQNRATLDSTLANKGIKVGSTAYQRAMDDFATQQSNARDNLYGNMYDRATKAILTERNQPINEITALTAGSQVTNPMAAQTAQTGIEGTDLAGLIQNKYNADLNQWQTGVNQQNAFWGGLAGLGGSLLGGWAMSDKRAKTDIKKVGKLDDAINLYRFKYKKGMGGGGLTQLGVMAQEVEKVDPKAVAKGRDGYKRVNYDRVMERIA